MSTSTIILLVSLFFMIWQGTVITGRLIYRQLITGISLLIYSLGVVGVLAHVLGIY